MLKKLLFFFTVFLCAFNMLKAQTINITNVTLPNAASNRFATCGNVAPTITATFVPNAPGSHVSGGLLVCDDPCDTTTIDIVIHGLMWNQSPNANWIHSIYTPDIPGISIAPAPPPIVQFDAAYTYLSTSFGPPPCTGAYPGPPPAGTGGHVTGGTGYYFVGNLTSGFCPGGGSTPTPCDNYGDPAKACGTLFDYPFRIRLCNNKIVGSQIILSIRADSDGNTGCWSTEDQQLNKVMFWLMLGPGCAPLYSTPTATNTPITKTCSPTTQYSTTLTATCGNSRTVEWYTAAAGGTLVGTGSPFTYITPTCPAGTTLYAACCPISTVCGSRKAYAITGTCPPGLVMTPPVVTQPTCIVPTGSIDASGTVTGGSGTITYTINGGSPNTTGIFGGLAPGGYTITATDAAGCQASQSVTINPPTGATFTPSSTTTGASCPGISNGGIIVTVVPAGTYTYTLDGNAATTNSTGIFTSVSGGAHTVTVANSTCNATVNVNVAPGTALSATSTTTAASCPGISDGSVTITAPTGTAPYSYSINTTPVVTNTTGIFPGLAGGPYVVSMTDANGCTGTFNTSVGPGTAITASAAATNTTCNNATNGIVTTTPANAGTYVLNTTPTVTNTTGVFNNLPAGNYTVTYTNVSGCSATTTQVIVSPGLALTATASTTAASCPGINNGTVTISSPTGTAPFSYTINTTPAVTNATGIFTGLAGGPYTVVITDANGCNTGAAPIAAAVGTGTPITVTATATPTSCNNATNGTITSLPANAGTYSLNTTPATTNTSGVFNNLPAGTTYVVTLTDVNGCTASTGTITVVQGAVLSATAASTGAACSAINNGTVTVTAPTGTAPFTYTINTTPPVSNPTGIFSGLAGSATPYVVNFVDANGCTGSVSTTVTTGAGVTVSGTPTATSTTNAADGTATGVASGGTAPYGYVINATPANTTGAANGIFTGLPAGTYTITATDANGCTGTVSLTITPGPGLSATVTTANTSCPAISDGTVTLTNPTGVGPWTYTINATPPNTTGASTGVFMGLAANTYSVTIIDANGSTGTVPATVTANTPPTVSATATATSCNNATDGTITTSPANPGSYTINTAPPVTNTTGIFNNLPAGPYQVTYTTAAGCVATANATVGSGLALGSTFTTVNASCPAISDGSLTVTPTTGTGPFSYTINTTPPVTNTTGTFTGLAAGPYVVTFTAANTCTGITASIAVAASPALTASAVATTTSCNNATDGIITTTPANAGSYTINTTPPVTNTTGIFNNLPAGNYIVTYTNAAGCVATTSSVPLSAGLALNATSSTTNASCPGVSDGSLTVTPTSGTGPFSFTLNTTPPVTNTTGIFSGLAVGIYNVTFTAANTCTGTAANIQVQADAALSASATGTATSCNNAIDGSVTVTPANAGSYTINTTPPVTNTTGTFTGLAAGPYSVTYTNAAGCIATAPATVNPGLALISTFTTVNASCPAISDGSLTVTPTTGTGPFSYTINTTPPVTNTTGTFTGLAAGPYIVTFTAANTCTGITSSIVVAANPALTASAVAAATSCNNATDGTVTTTPANAGSYTINTTPPVTNTTGIFTGLAAGPYSVTYTNAAGCIATAPATVNPGLALISTFTTVNASCPAINDGSLTVTPTTGTGPFSYTINTTPPVTNTTGTFSGLAAGPYIVTFTAANTCTGITSSIVVAANPALTASAVAAATSCNNATDGTVTVTPANAGSYTINTTPPVTNTTGIFTGLAAGPYSVTYTNAAGCIATAPATVNPGLALISTFTTVNASCPAISDGSLTVTPTTGTGPFSYTINTTPPVTNTTGTFTGLAAGPYIVTFTAANTCTGTTSSIMVAADPALTASAAATATSCNNATDGTVTTTPANAGSYTINTTPPVTNTTGIFNNLSFGLYHVTYTNAAGCSAVTPDVNVAQGSVLNATPTTTGTACPGIDNGTFTATAPTGVAPFTYTINATPANTSGAANGTFTQLPAGTYIITFTAANGCTGTVTGIVAPGAALTSTAASVNPNCAGIDDGTFTVTPTNGAAPYTYTIDATPSNTTGAATGAFTGLAPGTYIITFTDANGCTGTQTKALTTNAPITTPEAHTDVKCFGGTDGTITLTPAGGVAPFTYALLPSTTFQASSTITGLGAGSHTIRVKDNVGCTKDTTIIIAEPVQLTASAVKDNNATCEGNDGGITVTAAGGTTPYQYSIDNGVTYQAAGVFTNAANTTYSGNIKVTDANGCTATANSVTVGQDNNLTLDILTNPDTTICQGSSVKFTPVLTNAGASATYSWTSLTPVVPNSTIDSLHSLNATVYPVDTAIYKLTVTYKACTISDNVPVNVIWKPIVNAGPSAVSICLGDSILLMGSVTHTSGPIDSLVWTPTDSLTTPVAAQTWAHPVNNTYYHLTAYTSIANYGCLFAPQAYDSIKVVIPAPVIAFAGNDTIAVKGQPHQLLGSGGVSYTWSSPTITISNPLAQNPFVTLYNDANFSVIVKNAIGCADTASVFVKVLDGPAYYIPNAFSPNGDGLNDVFRAIPAGMANTQYFKVMNRYGETVFETNQYLKGWDGTFKGKKQPLGVYVWFVKGQDKDGKTVEMKGTVMLIQ